MTILEGTKIVRNSVFDYLQNTASAQFCYLKYTNEAKETSVYKLLLNTNFLKMYEEDLQTLENMQVSTEIEKEAKAELIASIEKAIRTKFQHEKSPTKNMTALQKSIKFHEQKDEMYLHCLSLEKKVIVPGTYKSENPSEKTIVKNRIKRQLKQSKIRFFTIKLDKIERIALNGHRVVIITQ